MTWNLLGRISRTAAVLVGAVLTAVLAGQPASAQQAEPCLAGSWELSGPLAHTGLAVRMESRERPGEIAISVLFAISFTCGHSVLLYSMRVYTGGSLSKCT